jgi:hypothetical protein
MHNVQIKIRKKEKKKVLEVLLIHRMIVAKLYTVLKLSVMYNFFKPVLVVCGFSFYTHHHT